MTRFFVPLLALSGAIHALESNSTSAIAAIPTDVDLAPPNLDDLEIEHVKLNKYIYLIRHGEKPDDEDDKYLSPRGEQRAACLAAKWKAAGFTNLYCPDFDPDTNKRGRACQTLRPLSKAIPLPLNSDFDRDDPDGVAAALLEAVQDGPVLLAWEHKVLTDIGEALGGASKTYPKKEFDLIWTFDPVARKFLRDTKQHC
ncbi:Aste57867_20848 [Aphanomyces stellatus]|uniref:Aste57867_20848 protein n=1 Tax=Aphanomyces stellatus TaxID=120398 RepID=A0A485LI10_9STRA|nr:hypothetical protein As57867_020780 [Aphanomyces stellatus]VFT97526.1 Aste57867_20848 [Aphanomyces stellatus]